MYWFIQSSLIMRMHQILDNLSIAVTNEEKNFIKTHSDHISVSSLNEHETWIAQNLVRKNIYTVKGKNLVLNYERKSNI